MRPPFDFVVDNLIVEQWLDDGVWIEKLIKMREQCDERIKELEAENTILKEREDGLNNALKLADAEIDRLSGLLHRSINDGYWVGDYWVMDDDAMSDIDEALEKNDD